MIYYSTWRMTASEVIADALKEAKAQDLAGDEMWKYVRKAYPFGQRKHWPYKAWLIELRKARKKEGMAEAPLIKLFNCESD